MLQEEQQQHRHLDLSLLSEGPSSMNSLHAKPFAMIGCTSHTSGIVNAYMDDARCRELSFHCGSLHVRVGME